MLSTVNVAKACGYDGISNRIIKFCSAGLCKVFTRLINLSISFGQFPSAWKIANVLPLFKKDNRQLKFNYRPVSLLSCLSKICERVVFIHLYDFLAEIGFFYKFQSGFRPGDSTEMQLLALANSLALGKLQTFYLCLKKIIGNLSLIIDLFHSYLVCLKYARGSFSFTCTIFLPKLVSSINFNPVFAQAIQQKCNFFILFIESMKLLRGVMKSGLFFLIYLRLSIRFGTVDY